MKKLTLLRPIAFLKPSGSPSEDPEAAGWEDPEALEVGRPRSAGGGKTLKRWRWEDPEAAEVGRP